MNWFLFTLFSHHISFWVQLFKYRINVFFIIYQKYLKNILLAISQTVKKFILDRVIGWGCRCAMSWCDLDLIFNLVIMTFEFENLIWAISHKTEGTGS